MGEGARHFTPAGEVGDEIAEASARLWRELVAVEQLRRRDEHRLLCMTGALVHGRNPLVAETALGHVDDPLECEVVGWRLDQAEVSDGIADLRAFVKTEAADDLVGQADRDEALLELSGLELGTNEDCRAI